MTIIPTCVLSATQFYGQLGSYFNTLEYSQKRLNMYRSRYEYEPFAQIPGIFLYNVDLNYFDVKFGVAIQIWTF